MYIEGSQIIYMFCKECDRLLSQYDVQHLEFMIEAISFTQRQPAIYGREVYLHFIAKVAVGLSMAYNCHLSNYKNVYNRAETNSMFQYLDILLTFHPDICRIIN